MDRMSSRMPAQNGRTGELIGRRHSFFSMIGERTLAFATSRGLDEASIVAEKRYQAVAMMRPRIEM
jgi:hypothetical protein